VQQLTEDVLIAAPSKQPGHQHLLQSYFHQMINNSRRIANHTTKGHCVTKIVHALHKQDLVQINKSMPLSCMPDVIGHHEKPKLAVGRMILEVCLFCKGSSAPQHDN